MLAQSFGFRGALCSCPRTAAGSSRLATCALALGLAIAATSVAQTYSISTLAGTAGSAGSNDGTGTAARLNHPGGITLDAAGVAYVAEVDNHIIRRITPAGATALFAGAAGSAGSADGTGGSARFFGPSSLVVDRSGTIFVSDLANRTVRRLTPAALVTTFAGAAGQIGAVDGTGAGARFSGTSGLALDSAGNLYAADYFAHTIRKISPAGVVTTLAGTPGLDGTADGATATALFRYPNGLAIDSGGNLFVADYGNHTIRQITPAGIVTTLAGLAGATGSADGAGSAARFNGPAGIAADTAGNLFVGDSNNHLIRRITPAGVVTTIAGAGVPGAADGIGAAARFNGPSGIAIDAAGNLYICDYNNHTIRKAVASNAPAIIVPPQSQSVAFGGNVTLSVTATGLAPLSYQWRLGSTPIAGATAASLALTNVQAGGAYSVTVSNSAGTVTSASATISVVGTMPAPTITTAPAGVVAEVGGRATLSVAASGTGLSYQWQLNGASLAGATGATLALDSLQPRNVGSYSVVVANNAGSVTSRAATLALAPARLMNLSVRSVAGTGNQVLTTGFVIAEGQRQVLVRGIGPALGAFGLDGVLADPRLGLFNGSQQVQSNDDWGGASTLAAAFTQVGAFALPPASKDAALLTALGAGAYTAQITSTTGTGISLVELYDTTTADAPSASRLINVSTRTLVGTGDNILTAGFFVTGGATKTLLIRGVGPTLAQFGITGALADPQLKLFVGGTQIQANDDWGGGAVLTSTFAQVGAFPLPAASKDAALLLALPPGLYTAQLSGVNNTTGIALVEIYDADGLAAPVFVTQPASVVSAPGSPVTFTAGVDLAARSFQWQRQAAGSSGWQNLADGGGFAGTTTPTLTLSSAAAGASGDRFRVIIASLAGATISDPATLTVTSSSLRVAAFTAPTAEPMSLVTVSVTGLNTTEATYVEFSTPAGVVADVPATAVTASSVTVAIPPLTAADGVTPLSGPLSAKVVQLIGETLVPSNTFTIANVQAPPRNRLRTGALTASLLRASLEAQRDILANLGGNALDSAPLRASLAGSIAALESLIANVERAAADPGFSFVISGDEGTPIRVSQKDLQAVDQMLLATLRATSRTTSDVIASVRAGEPPRAALDGSPMQSSAGALAQSASSDNPDLDLIPGAREFVYAPRQNFYNATPQAFNTTNKLFSSTGAIALGLVTGAAMVVGAPVELAVALPTAALLYVSVNYIGGTIGLGAAFGQNTAAGRQLVQQGLDELEQQLKRFKNAITPKLKPNTNLPDPSSLPSAQLKKLDGYLKPARELGQLLSGPPLTPATNYSLNIVVNGGVPSTRVTASPSQALYASGTVVTLSASPPSSFINWSGDLGGTSATQNITMTANRTVTANFGYTLAVNRAGTGSGSVSASPSATVYAPGSSVTLSASPGNSSTFTGWSGDLGGTATSQTLTMSGNKTVTATFTLQDQGNVARFDGTYRGSYDGQTVFLGYRQNTSGTVTLVVSNGVITVTSPGTGRGTLAANGAASFNGSGGVDGTSYRFDGVFTISSSGVASASGGWSATFDGGSGSGTWRAAR